jgi:hypothetical protein
VAAEWLELKARMKDAYHRIATEDAPTEDEIKEALATLAGAWDQVAGAFSAAMRDPDNRAQLKRAAGSLAAAVGATLSGLGGAIDDRSESDDQPADHGT